MYNFERVLTTTEANAAHAALLATVFEKPQLFTPQFIKWQYGDNPVGNIVGFNAMAGNVIAAHYVTQPLYANLNGQHTKGLLSLNTATHNDHRGKGLFTQLAEKTYETAASEGFSFVVGVANQNSVHGFTKKLGFQLVGQLHAKVGLGQIPALPANTGLQYEREWDAETLAWRLQNPSANYFSRGKNTISYFSKTHLSFIKSQLISVPDTMGKTLSGGGFNPITLYIGAEQGLSFKGKLFFDIPMRFRPAPLYLIFKDLTGKGQTLNFENIRFKLIDFDAY
jgi:hypothetical protein